MNARSIITAGLLVLATVSGGRAGDGFVPGHVFVAEESLAFCLKQDEPGGTDRIWEIDPKTGEVTLFAELSSEQCGPVEGCGDPNAGNCCFGNSTPYCEEQACCEAVCAVDDFCCAFIWDAICASEAWDLCTDVCDGPGACGSGDDDCCIGCSLITGLAFTPDGTRLRASSALSSNILEFDAQGNYSVALGIEDGIAGPFGRNNLAYDAEDNFYVVNAGPDNIVKFPVDGGPGEVFADAFDGIGGGGAIAVASDGDLYFGNFFPNNVLRIDPDGEASVFDEYGDIITPLSVTTDMDAHVFVGLEGAPPVQGARIYKYVAGEAESQELLVEGTWTWGGYVITMSPDQTTIYAAVRRPWPLDGDGLLLGIDALAGTVTELALIPADAGVWVGSGIAVAPYPPGDMDFDGDVDLDDFALFHGCLTGPAAPDPPLSLECHRADLDSDADVDMGDVIRFQLRFGDS